MSSANGLAVEVRGLTKRYGSIDAIRAVDLDVRVGEVFALLGPNGAGKTTTVEVLEGFRSRTAGEVRVLGEDPASAGREWRSRIGLVLQSSQVADEVTVAEIVGHFAAFYPRPRSTAEVLELVGLTGQSEQRAETLSGGQKRRLDVALGIVGRPELLFLDEPTTGFDPEARRQFWELIVRLRGEGTTILLTTHYLDEAEALADRVGVLTGGRIAEVAAPSELGGRATAPVTVRWREGGELRTQQTATPTRVVAELAARFADEVPELAVLRPSLEDVYLAMIAKEKTQ